VYLYDIDEAPLHPPVCATDRAAHTMIRDKQLPTVRIGILCLEKWLATANPDVSPASTTATHDDRSAK
jgi:hypothetical protein